MDRFNLTPEQRDEYLLYLDEQKRGCVREDREAYQKEIDAVEELGTPDRYEFALFVSEYETDQQIRAHIADPHN